MAYPSTQQIIEAYQRHGCVTRVRSELQLSDTIVKVVLLAAGIEPRGADVPTIRERMDRVTELYGQGANDRVIAHELSLSSTTVGDIRRGLGLETKRKAKPTRRYHSDSETAADVEALFSSRKHSQERCRCGLLLDEDHVTCDLTIENRADIRSNGAIQVNESSQWSPVLGLCNYHTTGVPWGAGRFFSAGCRVCEEKAARDPSLKGAPRPREVSEKRRKTAVNYATSEAA